MSKMVYRICIFVVIIICAAVYGYTGCSRNDAHVHGCGMCGMDVDKSETKYRLKLNEGAIYACSFSCATVLNKRLNKKFNVNAVETTVFNTSNYVNINDATFVTQSDVIPKGSMPPFVLAFSSRRDAERFIKKHKGIILNLESVNRQLEKMFEKLQ